MLYPQNDDRIVVIDSVTSLHPVYKKALCLHARFYWAGLQLATANARFVCDRALVACRSLTVVRVGVATSDA